jgi:6,7-dimethyl-8-ribityllumazine synthase
MSTHVPVPIEVELPMDTRVAVIVARFNAHVTDVLLAGCRERFLQRGLDAGRIDVHAVPGAFELPTAAKLAAVTKRYHAVVCLGCVIRGDTPHFDFVAGEAARGIMRVGIDESLPVLFGVLTTNTEDQALARSGGTHGHAGIGAADAAMEMIALARKLRSGR